MKYLIYVSSAAIHFSEEDLKIILENSRENNSKLGITGMLLYADGNFIQVIEGEAGAIDALYSKITKDDRHRAFSILMQGEIKERSFGEWSMGFKKVSKEDFADISGYSNLSAKNPDYLAHLDKGPILLLLKNFLKINAVEARYTS